MRNRPSKKSALPAAGGLERHAAVAGVDARSDRDLVARLQRDVAVAARFLHAHGAGDRGGVDGLAADRRRERRRRRVGVGGGGGGGCWIGVVLSRIPSCDAALSPDGQIRKGIAVEVRDLELVGAAGDRDRRFGRDAAAEHGDRARDVARHRDVVHAVGVEIGCREAGRTVPDRDRGRSGEARAGRVAVVDRDAVGAEVGGRHVRAPVLVDVAPRRRCTGCTPTGRSVPSRVKPSDAGFRNRIVTLFEPRLATARSGRPSALKSPTSIWRGLTPVGMEASIGRKPLVGWRSRTVTPPVS